MEIQDTRVDSNSSIFNNSKHDLEFSHNVCPQAELVYAQYSFFSTVKNILDTKSIDDNSKSNIELLFKYLCKIFQLEYNPDYRFLDEKRLNDLEKIMTTLSMAATLFGDPESTKMFDILTELIASTIKWTLPDLHCSQHKMLVELFKKEDIIISFNYDLLLDTGLRDCQKLDRSSYQINFDEDSDDIKTDNNKKIELLKLHGSLNWLKCSNCDKMFLRFDEKPVNVLP